MRVYSFIYNINKYICDIKLKLCIYNTNMNIVL